MIKKISSDFQRHIKFHGFFWTKHLISASILALSIAYLSDINWQNIFLTYTLIILFYHVRQIQKLNLTFKQYLGYEDLDDEYQSFEDLKKANPNSALWQEIYYFLNKHDLKHNKKQEKLQKKYQNFVQAIEASPNGVMICQHNGEILWLNQMISQFLQLKKEDAGKNIYGLLRQPKFHDYFKQIYQKTIDENGQEKHQFNHEFAKNSAPTIQLAQHFLKIEWIFIDQNRALFIFRDITEIQQLENARRDFLNHISHELSTPLTVILGYSEALLDMLPQQNESVEMIQSIHQRANDMHSLIQDLLLMNKLESDKRQIISATHKNGFLEINQIHLNPLPDIHVNTQSSLNSSLRQTYQPLHNVKDIKENLNGRLLYLVQQCQKLNENIKIYFKNNVTHDISYPKTKSRYIDTIFNNIIQNALFYSTNIDINATNHFNFSVKVELNNINADLDFKDTVQDQNIKSIAVNVAQIIKGYDLKNHPDTFKHTNYHSASFFNLEKIDASLLFLKIDVIDQGIGIEAIHLPLLTQSFYRVDESRTHLSGGTGLGLALVAQVLENMGGCLCIQSSAGQGSCFSIYLPIIP